jgi:phosphoserine phosphatase
MTLKLAIFDLDGTLKEARDPYVYLHQRLGTWEASQAFFSRGLAGELDYDEWLRLDTALWQGVPRATFERIFQENPYLPGARETVADLKRAGVRVAVVSTGLSLHAEQVAAELGLDRIYANEIYFEDGRATGRCRAHVREGGKGPLVARLQSEFGVVAAECLAVGDGSSDADMFPLVHAGVAVNPSSERVRAAARLVLDGPDLGPLVHRLRALVRGWLPVESSSM